MNLSILLLSIYSGIVILVCGRIVLSTKDTGKALAYILFSLFIPIIGIGFYLVFGENYLNKKRYRSKLEKNQRVLEQLKDEIVHIDKPADILKEHSMSEYRDLVTMLNQTLGSPITNGNSIKILHNGEGKFPELIEAIREANHHIHLEYYIFRNDGIGSEILELLVGKAKQGVEVRLIYDDFGSPGIEQKLKQQLIDAGGAIFPFYEIKFYLLANRYNYRNHRKLVIVDGTVAFVGGINVADEYINSPDNEKYWRDTHLLLRGPSVYYLQYLFMADWNFCCKDQIKVNSAYFTEFSGNRDTGLIQIVASGPDSSQPSILYAILQAIYSAKKEILITTPYFIPGKSFMDALCTAALSGLQVKILVPVKSDSKIADAASSSYFTALLETGVEVYLYKKGFLHSKTMVIDSTICIIGTANMDNRSFELNFEVNAIVYEASIAKEMHDTFFLDLESSDQIIEQDWRDRPWHRRLHEKAARLFSPVL